MRILLGIVNSIQLVCEQSYPIHLSSPNTNPHPSIMNTFVFNRIFGSFHNRFLRYADSRWLSFSRQLNNYGFISSLKKEMRNDSCCKLKSFHHPKFHRDITDPIALSRLLPYLPGKRRREKERKVGAVTNTKRPKYAAPPATFKSTTLNRSARVKTVTPTTKALGNSALKIAPIIRNDSGADDDVTLHSRTGICGGKTKEGTVKEIKQTRQGKDIAALVDFLKTPSPRYRSTKADYMSSPPPLSHYLQPKHRTDRQPPDSQNSQQGTRIRPNLSSNDESPLPSSLLTVNFVMTPSPLSSDNLTPRTHNLSSTLVASASHSSTTTRSPDGVQMLSWAARAVESPVLERKRKSTDRNTRTPDIKTKANSISFTDAIGYSPIVRTKGSSLEVAELFHKFSSTSPEKTSFASSFPNSPRVAIFNNDGSEPSPLCFREHQDSEIELDFLRNCLEDVFVASDMVDTGTIVPPHCGSATMTAAKEEFGHEIIT